MHKRIASVIMAVVLLVSGLMVVGCPVAEAEEGIQEGSRNVIFFHPDGYGPNHWNALRIWLVGPDDRLNWDRLPYMAPYTEHMRDDLTASSHGGATTHAYGVKVARDSFGLDEHEVITALSGEQMSIVEEAIQAGFATALIGSGCITEPGTAAFVASVEERGMREEIAKQVIEAGVHVMLGGGERWLLPVGVTGRHGEGRREDGLNLIERARQLGYTVVFDREELQAAVAGRATKVLGVFACGHTFNCEPEEVLRAEGLPHYWPWVPTIAEMSAAAIEILSRHPKATEKGIFIVAEEEGTDNFPNDANAMGSFIAGERADAAFRVFADFVEENPNTLLITAGDSAAGGKHLLRQPGVEKVGEARINTGPGGEWVKAPLLDGVDGPGTAPFLSAPDREGNRWQFAVAWATPHDLSAGIVARAKGLNANLVTELGVVDNTDIYRLIYYTLFGKWLGEPLQREQEELDQAVGELPITPINQVDMVDVYGLPIRAGERVAIEGIATVGTGVLCIRNTMIFVQDETGGISVFTPDIAVEVKAGDRVSITGEVGHYHGLTQLRNPNVKVLAHHNPLPWTHSTDVASVAHFNTAEAREGELVRMHIRISSLLTQPRDGAYHVAVTDIKAASRVIMRVGPGTGINVGALRVDDEYMVTGIIGQRDLFKPHHQGHRIHPRSEDDLLFKRAGTPPEDSVFPSPNTVAAVVDGDGIMLENPVVIDGNEVFEVRLLGIDAPEVFPIEGFAYYNQVRHGERATEFLRYLLPVGTEITLNIGTRKLCGLGRLLAIVKVDCLDVNKELLRQGYVVKFVVWPNSYAQGRFEALRAAMLKAKEFRSGLWCATDPLEEIPLVYRARIFGHPRYIGDFETKRYVPLEDLEDMEQMAMENRVYFFAHKAVVDAGYSLAGGD